MNLRSATYTANGLNQYSSRSNPASVDIIGLGEVGSSVTVNGSGADYRRGEYFREDLGLSTGVDPLWQSVSVTAGATTIAGHLLIPPATQSFSYDRDGNLTSDGVWTYYYDAENRLYRLENTTSLSPASARKKLLFEYDHLGRRIRKQVYAWGTSDYSTTATTDTRFFYDGWNLVKETTGSAWKSYMWGLDLSGTMEGAGGVGGLLLFNDSALGAHFPCYDANGNITKLIKVSDSTTSADYEYDPFGQMIRMSGTASEVNPFRFSSKYQDDETDLVYYGYRFYSPTLGRWVNRDPIEENGGVGLSVMLANDTINRSDFLGLEWIIERHNAPRPLAYATDAGDTFDDLARKLKLDISDLRKWLEPADTQVSMCTIYSVPNTIYVDFGIINWYDYMPTAILGTWRREAEDQMGEWLMKGYYVDWSEYVTGGTIKRHLKDRNLYGYLYVGHGGDGASIGFEGSADGNSSSEAVFADRYTDHGIAFMYLKACFSAQHVPIRHRNYKYNAWESNVSQKGAFIGYIDSVNLLSDVFYWRVTHGKNDQGLNL